MIKPISYSKLESTLNKIGAQINTAEAHGLLTGMLSITQPKTTEAEWKSTFIENLECKQPNQIEWKTISNVSKQILSSFNQVDFSFNLLLPDDDTQLNERIEALGGWCRGYLSGLGLVGITAQDLSNDVIKELVHDLSQIAHVSMQTDSSEEDENNYVELVEFVRVAVQNIQVELKGSETKRMLH